MATTYQNASFKCSHNSYQRDESIPEQLIFHPQTPALCGCRAIEIDITRHSDGSGGSSGTYFQVSHDQGGTGDHLNSYLAMLLGFHFSNPAHDPIFVTLDIKSEAGSAAIFPDEIDTYLRTWFDASIIFAPVSLMADPAMTLLDNVQTNGWPSVEEMNGKFIFCLSGYEAWKALYAASDPDRRLCFSDFDVADDDAHWSVPPDGKRVVANIHLFSDHKSVWARTVPLMRDMSLLVRGWKLNGATLWNDALEAGVNVLATDEVSGKSWAHVGSTPFVFS
jgi:hypothetical protein